jgi:hypothetical protein
MNVVQFCVVLVVVSLVTATSYAQYNVVCQDGTCQVVRTPVRNVVSATADVARNVVRTVAPEPVLYRQQATHQFVYEEAPVVPVLMYDMQTRAAIRQRVVKFFERLRRPFMFRRNFRS